MTGENGGTEIRQELANLVTIAPFPGAAWAGANTTSEATVTATAVASAVFRKVDCFMSISP